MTIYGYHALHSAPRGEKSQTNCVPASDEVTHKGTDFVDLMS